MATSDDELDRMEAAILGAMIDPDIAERMPDWATADDLSCIGIKALLDADPLGRTLASHGNSRITGDGVSGSSAKVTDVARVMAGFQRLATAVGASQAGDKALGKKANVAVTRGTELLLTAAPAPGSIVLTLTSALAPTDEAGPAGMLDEFETDDQMLDTAVGAAIDVFSAGNDIGPGAREIHVRASARRHGSAHRLRRAGLRENVGKGRL
ncbi:MAG: hypothetical protein WCE30_07240 [Mycobacterium sp.]